MKISKKTIKRIENMIRDVISFNNVSEFEDDGKLFEKPPDMWIEEERRLCDYQARMSSELISGIKNILCTKADIQKQLVVTGCNQALARGGGGGDER